MTATGSFDLTGRDGDETRLLVQPAVGYSLAVPGQPRIVTPRFDSPPSDIVLQLADAPIELGLRVETMAPDASLASLVTAYVHARARTPSDVAISPAEHRGLAPGATAAMSANYPLRGDDAAAMEFLAVTVRDNAALHVTARYSKSTTTPFAWGSLRSILLNHQSWTPGTLASVEVWPATTKFLRPSVAFELMPSAEAEARAKATDVGEIPRDVLTNLADVLLGAATSDDPPTLPWAPFVNQHATARLAMTVGSRVAAVLCRDIDSVDSMHDYRGWAWGCYWAVGNRPVAR